LDWRKRFSYGVDRVEVESFVEGHRVVKGFLRKYKDSPGTVRQYARTLCLFFNWLKKEKRLDLTPAEFLNEHLRKRGSLNVEDRRWALRLVLEFTRDNPDLKNRGDRYKYSLFMAIKQFFDYHEAELTSSKGVFGKHNKAKYKSKQMSTSDAKKVLGALSQRERAICMVMLQSGQGVGEVLNKLNFMYDYVVGCIKAGAKRIRVDFEERKGNGFNYFTFVSRDAIQELKKWLAIRRRMLERENAESSAIFITRTCKPLTVEQFQTRFADRVTRAKLKTGPFTVRSHMFRKLFKTESRPPERGIDQDCIEFMMGHSGGIEGVGGVYDRTPELYAGVIEREYAKLESYINIYSGKTAETEGLGMSEEDVETLKQVLQLVKQGKIRISV